MNDGGSVTAGVVATLEAWTGDWLNRPGLIVFVLVATLAIDMVQRFLFAWLRRRARTTDQVWDDAIAGAAGWPVSILVWTIGLSVAAVLYSVYRDLPLPDLLGVVQSLAIVFAVTWFAARFTGHAVDALYTARSDRVAEERGQLDRTTARTIGRLLRAAIVVIGIVVAMHTIGVNIAGILAFGGIGGIAVGLAARDMLSNVFGGLSVFMDRPFNEGDWISSPEKDIEGQVESIGWRVSMIRRADKSALYVPNSIFLSVPVRNMSRMSARRFDKRVSVRFDDVRFIPDIVREISAAIENDADIDATQNVNVALEEYSASGAVIRMIAFSPAVDFASFTAMQQRLLLVVERVLEVHGARLSYPTTTLDMSSAPMPLRPADDDPAD